MSQHKKSCISRIKIRTISTILGLQKKNVQFVHFGHPAYLKKGPIFYIIHSYMQ